MRRSVLLLSILLATSARAQPSLTPEMCAEKADAMTALTRFTLNSANRIAMAGHQPLADIAPRRVRDAAERAETARLSLLEAMHEYSDATDALSYQLFSCSK